MAVELKCDFCGRKVDRIAFKVYLAPVLPNKAIHSYQSVYSHYADACENCGDNMKGKMVARKARTPKASDNGKVSVVKRKKTRAA